MAIKNDVKTLWNDIKRSPGLLIAIIVVIIAILYFVYRQNNPATTTDQTQPTQSPYRVEVFSITPPASSGGGTTDTGTGTPAPTQSQLITSTTGWLASTPGGTNNKGQNITNLPSGAALSLISGPVSFGTSKYYKVSYQGKTGYVNARTVGLA